VFEDAPTDGPASPDRAPLSLDCSPLAPNTCRSRLKGLNHFVPVSQFGLLGLDHPLERSDSFVPNRRPLRGTIMHRAPVVRLLTKLKQLIAMHCHAPIMHIGGICVQHKIKRPSPPSEKQTRV